MKKTVIFVILFLCVGPVWAGWTVYNFDNGYLPDDIVNVIDADDSGYVWFSGLTGGLIKTDGDLLWSQYLAASSGLIDDRVTDIFFDDSGYVWAATIFGASRYDGDTSWLSYGSADNMPHIDLSEILVEHKGYIWFGNFAAGFTKYDRDTTFIVYSTDSGLVENRIQEMIFDQDGGIWLATMGGASYFDTVSTFINYTAENSGLLDNTVHSVLQDELGYLWFGSDSGVSSLSPDSVWTTYTTVDGLAPGPVVAMAEDSSGNLWFGHNYHSPDSVLVTRFDRGSEMTVFDIGNNIYVDYTPVVDITVDTAGRVWVATSGEGISMYEEPILDVTENNDAVLPRSFSLEQNYPNPFNASTAIEFSLDSRTDVRLTVYNMVGQKVKTLIDEALPAGDHRVIWNSLDDTKQIVSSGVYLYKLETSDGADSRIMVLMK